MRVAYLLPAFLLGCSPDYELGSGFDPLDDQGSEMPSVPSDQETGPFDLDGDGEIDGDHYDLGSFHASDILIYGDTSSSMTDELVTLGQNILAFTDRLAEAGSDWHLMAVTGDSGCAIDGVFTADTADFDTRFAAAITTPPADTDSDEMGLQHARNAVTQALGGCNDGFLRSRALLHVIFISDENDESPGFEEGGYWSEYTAAIVGAKGDEDLVRFSAVAGPTPDGCAGAEAGFGYDEVVHEFDGEFISICDNWPDRLDTLAQASVDVDVFELSAIPVVDSIEVWVNAELRTWGWVYEPDGNQVRFTGNAPESGDDVDIFYEVL